MIQGGDPDGTGAGGPAIQFLMNSLMTYISIKWAFLPWLTVVRTLGVPKFFITLGPTDWLDNKHTIFGTVVQGMDVVEKIGKSKNMAE